jgi:hypothetical protein
MGFRNMAFSTKCYQGVFSYQFPSRNVILVLVYVVTVAERSEGPSTLLVLVLQPIQTTSKYTDPHAPKPGEQLK